MPPADNTRHLIEASRNRHRQAREHAEDAIRAATRSRARPTIAGIAQAAEVSRSWLYTQPDLITAIGQLQNRQPSPSRTGRHPASDQSLRQRLETALTRNKQLRDQIADLTRRLEAAHGELRRIRTLAPGAGVSGRAQTTSTRPLHQP
jgi:Family of unknown function (DUF6262)